MAGERLHAKQVQSVTNAVVGVVHAVSLSIHAIGAGLAAARGLEPKHAIKQVDRLLSRSALNVWTLFAHGVPYVVASSPTIVVALDWTDFDAEGPATIAASLVTAHGRALPLVWQTVPKARLKGRRNRYEDEVLLRLHEVLPPGVHVTVLADRGFGDHALYARLRDLASTSLSGFAAISRSRTPPGRADPRATGSRPPAGSAPCVGRG